MESEEESEKPQARRSSKTLKKTIVGEEEFREAVSTEESCQDMHPEELSTVELQKLKEQLNIRRRKSVSRGSVEVLSPPT